MDKCKCASHLKTKPFRSANPRNSDQYQRGPLEHIRLLARPADSALQTPFDCMARINTLSGGVLMHTVGYVLSDFFVSSVMSQNIGSAWQTLQRERGQDVSLRFLHFILS